MGGPSMRECSSVAVRMEKENCSGPMALCTAVASPRIAWLAKVLCGGEMAWNILVSLQQIGARDLGACCGHLAGGNATRVIGRRDPSTAKELSLTIAVASSAVLSTMES